MRRGKEGERWGRELGRGGKKGSGEGREGWKGEGREGWKWGEGRKERGRVGKLW